MSYLEGLNLASSTFLGSSAASAVPAVTAAAASPSLWQSFTSPFVSTFKGIADITPTLAQSAGNALNTILLSKAGLIPKAQNQGTYSVIYAGTPQVGNAPPTVIYSGGGSQPGSSAPVLVPASTPGGISTGVLVAIGLAGLIIAFMMARK